MAEKPGKPDESKPEKSAQRGSYAAAVKKAMPESRTPQVNIPKRGAYRDAVKKAMPEGRTPQVNIPKRRAYAEAVRKAMPESRTSPIKTDEAKPIPSTPPPPAARAAAGEQKAKQDSKQGASHHRKRSHGAKRRKAKSSFGKFKGKSARNDPLIDSTRAEGMMRSFQAGVNAPANVEKAVKKSEQRRQAMKDQPSSRRQRR